MKQKGNVGEDPSSQIKIKVKDVVLDEKGYLIGIISDNNDCALISVDKIPNFMFEKGILTLSKEDDNNIGFGIMISPTDASQTHPTNTEISYGNKTHYGKIISLSKLIGL